MNTTIVNPHRSSLGMDANVAVLVAFLATIILSWISFLGWIAWAVPLVFFFLEKESRFVKHQMIQLLCLAAVRAVVLIVVQILIWIVAPASFAGGVFAFLSGGLGLLALLWLISTLVGLALMAIEIYVVVMAYTWKQVELPILWPIVERISDKLDGFRTK